MTSSVDSPRFPPLPELPQITGAACVAACLAFGSAAEAQSTRDLFFDPEDGMFDVSGLLARGGFVPVPIIITEPAVEGGLGFVGQFVHGTPQEGNVSRTMVGVGYTGNQSWFGGIMHSGHLMEGKLRYTVGAGISDITLPIYPFGGSTAVEYNNKPWGLFANARHQIGESNWYTGPRLAYRTADISLGTEGALADQVNEFIKQFKTDLKYTALGWSLHYDSRDNPITPMNGVNAVLRYDQYTEKLGGDATFGLARASAHAFGTDPVSEVTLASMIDYQWVGEESPFFFAPGVTLRGVSHGRYAGDAALSIETELRRQVAPRWAGLVFGGYGESYKGTTKLYESEDGIWTYGAGFRYRMARRMGLDVGIDIARGPEETIWYIQFGHAWGRTMD